MTQAALFSALADETRWAILVRLGEAPASASALATELPVTRQAIARHVEILQAAGLVEAERSGREIRYRALGSRLHAVARELEAIGAGWDRALAAVKAEAERRARPS